MPHQTPHSEDKPAWSRPLLVALAAALAVTLALLAFAWPSFTSTPKDLPVSVVASEPAYDALTQSMRQQDAPFELARADSREEAEDLIARREAYGAFLIPQDPAAPAEVLTAPAANNSVATMMDTAGTALHKQRIGAALASGSVTDPQALSRLLQQSLKGPTVTEVAPLSEDDPQGSGLAVAAFPLTLGGIIGGVLISLKVRGRGPRLAAILAYSALAASALLPILHAWFGFLPTASAPLWGALALGIGATAALVTGLHSLLAFLGIGLGAVITMFLGNPLSGATLPLEFLPWHFDAIGRSLVPGATQELLRTLSYFPEASTAHAWWTLTAWTALSLLCLAVGRRQR
ncbi:hypothetical protein H7347_03795 [Corynebacterium sp. zg-331]|uniref:ABC transporter permease n=1 Tax=unclassified Corynebacterium TaxID=2624378 RepID=UPI00128DCB1F|nr:MULTISPECIES: ABC transporter permease [unclassified Corynebacterium]MBC3185703.1 hypothetical protein [Corynebacterium sp. zg-331]MPV52196.1 hypothetical protein [Corynebacterium sp. zg331]